MTLQNLHQLVSVSGLSDVRRCSTTESIAPTTATNDTTNETTKRHDSMLMTSTIELGHTLGLFRQLNEKGPLSAHDLAKNAELSLHDTLDWCLHAASIDILEYDESTEVFYLPPAEHVDVEGDADTGSDTLEADQDTIVTSNDSFRITMSLPESSCSHEIQPGAVAIAGPSQDFSQDEQRAVIPRRLLARQLQSGATRASTRAFDNDDSHSHLETSVFPVS